MIKNQRELRKRIDYYEKKIVFGAMLAGKPLPLIFEEIIKH